MFKLTSCLKGYTRDLDKTIPPEQTVEHIRSVLGHSGQDLLERTQRVDTGRLGIPVYMSICGPRARQVMPTRKQMGKGASAVQAEASALMEFVERYSLFAHLHKVVDPNANALTWFQAKARFGSNLIPVRDMLASVQEDRPQAEAEQILDLVRWSFCPAVGLPREEEVFLPLDWFHLINEFNGSAAGNTDVESVLQGFCELVERHVCAHINARHPVVPSIDPHSLQEPVAEELYAALARNGIQVWLKDFSLNTGLPTVGVLAYDPATFPQTSEIVFTAGTATSPVKAAIRAMTELAQLAGDFESSSCYEPSGLDKFSTLEQCAWLMQGPVVPLASLPDISHPDMAVELKTLSTMLQEQGLSTYVVDTTQDELQVPTHYCIAPGTAFRERSAHSSLGLFVGRLLAEKAPEHEAEHGLQVLHSLYPKSHFLPFVQGLFHLRVGRRQAALEAFARAEPLQPTAQEQAFAAFYQAYTRSQDEAWDQAQPDLNRAIDLAPDVHAFYNLRGVSHFKQHSYEQAISDFQAALRCDPGSAMDLANLGVCYKRTGQLEEALHYLQAGLDLDSSLDRARSELEELLAVPGNKSS